VYLVLLHLFLAPSHVRSYKIRPLLLFPLFQPLQFRVADFPFCLCLQSISLVNVFAQRKTPKRPSRLLPERQTLPVSSASPLPHIQLLHERQLHVQDKLKNAPLILQLPHSKTRLLARHWPRDTRTAHEELWTLWTIPSARMRSVFLRVDDWYHKMEFAD
jgi:hypothetical protein